MEGDNHLTARVSHAANSRLVDKRCYTPSPVKDWKAGNLVVTNSAMLRQHFGDDNINR